MIVQLDVVRLGLEDGEELRQARRACLVLAGADTAVRHAAQVPAIEILESEEFVARVVHG